jgi:ribosomal protein S18 acetylase RimI-like enzyme
MASSRDKPRVQSPLIRAARADDAEFLVTLSQQAFAPYSDDPGATMRRMMSARRANTIAIAEQRKRRAGFVVVRIEELGRDFGPLVRPSVAHLDAIAVRPNLVGRGIGRQLLEHAEQAAREQGAVSISLLTAESNGPAQRLFRGMGYQSLAPFDDVYADGQRGFAMFKSLLPVGSY